jgi:hypothetical protein
MLTNEFGLPQPFVDAATSHHEYKPNRYSVTELLGGTCEAVLKRRHQGEGEEDVADRVWAIFGTAVHKVLQEAEASQDQIQENWLCVEIDGLCPKYELSGIFDLYDDSTGTVTDYKTCSVWKLQVGDFEDWRRQTLMYCWLLRRAGFDASNGEVVAIMRDHNMRKAKTERDYPKHPVMRVEWHFTDDDIRSIEEHIYGWFHAVHEQGYRADEELWPCSPDQRWHKPDKWAVMQTGKKRAIRLFEDEEQAGEYMDQLIEKNGARYHMEFRQGEDTRCQSYCSVAQFCPYGRKFFQDSENSQTPSADSVL